MNFASEHPLCDFWIYDSSIDEHVCNSNMKYCFEDYKINCTREHIVAGKFMQIKSYRALMVCVTRTKALWTILLLRITYVPDFFMNFISMNKVKLKEMYWDNLNNKLIKKNKFFCNVKKWKGFYLLENNTFNHTNQKNNEVLFNFITKITVIQ